MPWFWTEIDGAGLGWDQTELIGLVFAMPGSGLEKTLVKKKKTAKWVFLVFFGLVGFFWVFLPRREGF